MPVDELLARMVANVWYPVNYFYLSFGKLDRLPQIVFAIQDEASLLPTASKADVFRRVLELLGEQGGISTELSKLARYVPYRFLRPFFAGRLGGISDSKVNNSIVDLAVESFHSSTSPPLYRFVDSPVLSIEIHSRWLEYMEMHLLLLEGFCLWNLLNYLQKNNANVPNIAQKMFEPQQRNLHQAKRFWDLVESQTGPLRCIYSGEIIQPQDFSIDHFLPWRFVAHDQLWNLIPASRTVNSAKSDNLPDTQLYLEPFVRTHYNALQVIAGPRQERLVEDYVLLFKKEGLAEVTALPYEQFREVLQTTIMPQMQIAKNMGFAANWSYSTS